MVSRRLNFVAVIAALAIPAVVACVGDDPSSGGTVTPQEEGGTNPIDGGGGSDTSSSTGTATITLAKTRRWVPQGSNATLAATIARGTAQGALVVRVKGLPAGVTSADVDVAPSANAATITFAGAGSAQLGATAPATIELYEGTAKLDAKSVTIGVSGAPGSLDTTWATSGVFLRSRAALGSTTTTGGDTVGGGVAVYPATSPHAGKILIAGKVPGTGASDQLVFVARLDANGALDTTFGEVAGAARAGYVRHAIGAVQPGIAEAVRVARVALDSQGRAVVLSNRFASGGGACVASLVRFTVDGVLDPAFTPFSGPILGNLGTGCGTATDVVIGSGDAPVVTAQPNYNNTGTTYRAGVIQAFNANGLPGVSSTVVPTGYTTAQLERIRIDAAGRYVVSGNLCNGAADPDALVCTNAFVRVVASGIDTTFGTGGVTKIDFGGTKVGPGESQNLPGLTAMSDGSFVAVGYDNGIRINTFARVTGDGLPVTTFGTGGKTTRSLLAQSKRESLYEVMVDDDERLIAVGLGTEVDNTSVILHTRMDAKGAPDPTYGTNSVSKISPVSVLAYGPRATLALDGRLLVVFNTPGANGTELAVWRYWP